MVQKFIRNVLAVVRLHRYRPLKSFEIYNNPQYSSFIPSFLCFSAFSSCSYFCWPLSLFFTPCMVPWRPDVKTFILVLLFIWQAVCDHRQPPTLPKRKLWEWLVSWPGVYCIERTLFVTRQNFSIVFRLFVVLGCGTRRTVFGCSANDECFDCRQRFSASFVQTSTSTFRWLKRFQASTRRTLFALCVRSIHCPSWSL